MSEKKTPTKRRSISKAKLYAAIKQAASEYTMDEEHTIFDLLETMKDDIVAEATK